MLVLTQAKMADGMKGAARARCTESRQRQETTEEWGKEGRKADPKRQVANAFPDFQGIPYLLTTPGDNSVFK